MKPMTIIPLIAAATLLLAQREPPPEGYALPECTAVRTYSWKDDCRVSPCKDYTFHIRIPAGDEGSIICTMGPSTNISVVIELLQANLNDCYDQDLVITGVYGPLTVEAMTKVQEQLAADMEGIYDSGIVMQTDGVYNLTAQEGFLWTVWAYNGVWRSSCWFWDAINWEKGEWGWA